MHAHVQNEIVWAFTYTLVCMCVILQQEQYLIKKLIFYRRVPIVLTVTSNLIHLEAVEHSLLLLSGNIMEIC